MTCKVIHLNYVPEVSQTTLGSRTLTRDLDKGHACHRFIAEFFLFNKLQTWSNVFYKI